MAFARRGMGGNKGGGEPPNRKIFTEQTLQAVADDLASGRLMLKRVTITDPLTPGLRAIVRNTGNISYHVHYKVGASRPYMKLGDLDKKSPEHISVDEARRLAEAVIALSQMGIDPQDGLRTRLVKELKAKGAKWRP